jgi:hypothetical protein
MSAACTQPASPIAFDGVCCAFMREALDARVVVATDHGHELWLTDDEGLFEVARIAYCPWCASNVAWLLPAPPMTTEGVGEPSTRAGRARGAGEGAAAQRCGASE